MTTEEPSLEYLLQCLWSPGLRRAVGWAVDNQKDFSRGCLLFVNTEECFDKWFENLNDQRTHLEFLWLQETREWKPGTNESGLQESVGYTKHLLAAAGAKQCICLDFMIHFWHKLLLLEAKLSVASSRLPPRKIPKTCTAFKKFKQVYF